MNPIGKGSRFRVLTGGMRGREGTIVRAVRSRTDWWTLDLGGGDMIEVAPGDVANLQRLSDAPAPPDALLAELVTAAHALGDRGLDVPQATLDEIRFVVQVQWDSDWDDVRQALVEAAALAIAGIRDIDRRTT